MSSSKELLKEIFEKRKSFSFTYDDAIDILEPKEPKAIKSLIDKEVIRLNGDLIELDDRFLHFFEQVLEVNEEINTFYINENIQKIKQNINYYFKENNTRRKYGYLKLVKSTLRKIGRIIIRNIVDLNRNVENIFKTEPNYKIKTAKLENYDITRKSINELIEQTEKLLKIDEIAFFNAALDEELKQIIGNLKAQLIEARHNLIEVQKQIINFLNRIKHQTNFLKKLRQVKYLKDQQTLENDTNFKEVLLNNNALFFKPKPAYPLKLSLDSFDKNEIHEIILKLNRKIKVGNKPKVEIAGKIDKKYLQLETENEKIIDLQSIMKDFLSSDNNLFEYLMSYSYEKEMSFENKLNIFFDILSNFENDLTVSNGYSCYKNIEFVLIHPK